MGYPKKVDFERGPIAAIWEQACAANGPFELELGSKRAADRLRYQLNGHRAAAKRDGWHLANQMADFTVGIEERNGTFFITFNRTMSLIPALASFRTAKEREEDTAAKAAAAQGAAKILEMLAKDKPRP